MPWAGRHRGSTRAWRTTRRIVAVRLAIAGALPCPYCGEPVSIGEPFDIDHRTPVATGGTDRLDNLAPAHPRCNRAAGARARTARRPPQPSRQW